MTKRDVLSVLLLVLGAGCGAAETPGPTEAPALDSTDVAAAPASASGTSAAEAAQPVLTLDAALGDTARGRLRSYDLWTFAEVHVKEIVAATPEQPAHVRYTMRLCTEDGRTEAIARAWSKEEGRKTLFTDSIYETARDATSHLYFECPYGTAWEVDATVEGIDGDRVRLAVRGEWRACTK